MKGPLGSSNKAIDDGSGSRLKSSQVSRLRTKPATPGKKVGKQDFTFESKEQAERFVNPVLHLVYALVRRTKERTVAGWANRLKMWLMRMERGNKHDARTPLFAKFTYQQISDHIMGMVDQNLKSIQGEYSKVPGFDTVFKAVENHQAEKIGPRGIFPPAHEWLDAKVAEIWCDKPPRNDLDVAAMTRALDWLASFKPKQLIDVDDQSWLEGFKTAGTDNPDDKSLNVDTNSCYPSYVRHWYHRVWDKSVDLVHRLVQTLMFNQCSVLWKRALKAETYKEIDFHLVATASQRTNVSTGHKATGDNTYKGYILSKLRAVCAMPKVPDTIFGKVFLNRLIPHAIEAFRNPDGTRMFVALTTPEQIDKNMQVLLETAHQNDLKVLSTDFSGYDATLPPWLAWEVAKRIATWMTPRASKVFLALIYAEFYQTSCITTTRIFPEGPSSMKSGGWSTNIMDSFCNLVVQRYGLEAGHFKSILAQAVQGDDALIIGEGCEPAAFEKSCAQVGLEANADKQYFELDSLSFCQKIHVLGYPGGIYPIARATAAMVSLEDDVGIETSEAGQFPYVLAFRTISRLSNACFNPLFVQLVNWVKDLDTRGAYQYPGQLCAKLPAAKLAKLAGSYATKFMREAIDKPWKSLGTKQGGFEHISVNRVLRGEIPPAPGIGLFEWVYGVSYASVAL